VLEHLHDVCVVRAPEKSARIAFFEYLLQVPANRMGSDVLNLSQLKIMQEAITLTVFVPFALLYMKQPIRLDFLWAALCLMGAVDFIFRG
jgi:uncharacterized protein (DUF486 family)